MPRRICGVWTQGEIWLHNASDFFIWTAYLAIPIVLWFFWSRRNSGVPFRSLFLLFGMFIIACGTTHLMEIVMFYHPVYRLAGVIKFVTAIVSWATVIALIPAIPRALAMRSPDELEAEVRARTAELEVINAQKDELLEREQRARRDAENAKNAAEKANRAKDEFLMTLSHELRTPLNAIQGWASLLDNENLPEDAKKQGLEVIQRNTTAQAQLIDDILQVSRIITGKLLLEPRPTELFKSVQLAISTVEPVAHTRNVALEIAPLERDILVMGDAARLQQIVWNLLSNAIKFTPSGGQIAVSLRKHNGEALIEVRDTGQGIEPDFLPFVFDRFRQADSSSTRKHGGLGLGLALVRHLTELHGGRVEAFSEGLGRGATFRVWLPLLENSALDEHENAGAEFSEDNRADSAAQSSQALRDLQILVVDDESEARSMVATMLQLHGARTLSAASSAQALRILEQQKVDLLLSDIGMPEENGLQLIQKVRRAGEGSTLPAIALTAYVSHQDRDAALRAGFDSHLAKPILPDALVGEIRRVLEL